MKTGEYVKQMLKFSPENFLLLTRDDIVKGKKEDMAAWISIQKTYVRLHDVVGKMYDYCICFDHDRVRNGQEIFERGKSYDIREIVLHKMSVVGLERLNKILNIIIEDLVTMTRFRQMEIENDKEKAKKGRA